MSNPGDEDDKFMEDINALYISYALEALRYYIIEHPNVINWSLCIEQIRLFTSIPNFSASSFFYFYKAVAHSKNYADEIRGSLFIRYAKDALRRHRDQRMLVGQVSYLLDILAATSSIPFHASFDKTFPPESSQIVARCFPQFSGNVRNNNIVLPTNDRLPFDPIERLLSITKKAGVTHSLQTTNSFPKNPIERLLSITQNAGVTRSLQTTNSSSSKNLPQSQLQRSQVPQAQLPAQIPAQIPAQHPDISHGLQAQLPYFFQHLYGNSVNGNFSQSLLKPQPLNSQQPQPTNISKSRLQSDSPNVQKPKHSNDPQSQTKLPHVSQSQLKPPLPNFPQSQRTNVSQFQLQPNSPNISQLQLQPNSPNVSQPQYSNVLQSLPKSQPPSVPQPQLLPQYSNIIQHQYPNVPKGQLQSQSPNVPQPQYPNVLQSFPKSQPPSVPQPQLLPQYSNIIQHQYLNVPKVQIQSLPPNVFQPQHSIFPQPYLNELQSPLSQYFNKIFPTMSKHLNAVKPSQSQTSNNIQPPHNHQYSQTLQPIQPQDPQVPLAMQSELNSNLSASCSSVQTDNRFLTYPSQQPQMPTKDSSSELNSSYSSTCSSNSADSRVQGANQSQNPQEPTQFSTSETFSNSNTSVNSNPTYYKGNRYQPWGKDVATYV